VWKTKKNPPPGTMTDSQRVMRIYLEAQCRKMWDATPPSEQAEYADYDEFRDDWILHQCKDRYVSLMGMPL
jgi:hypothetical protein